MTNKALVLIITILFTGCLFSVVAQDPPTPATPSIGDNATPQNNDIKLRSIELERVKRDAEKQAVLRRENGTELKFSVIKEDFEGIQKEQMKIIEAYTTGESINYPQISKSANNVTEMAVRLRGNVFTPKNGSDGGDDSAAKGINEDNPFAGKSIRDLIVALDNAIGDMVSSPMWQKLAVVDAEMSVEVEANVAKVINASGALWVEADKLTKK